MTNERRDWFREIVVNWQKYSAWDDTQQKWHAKQKNIMGYLQCSRDTARKFAAYLDLVELPTKQAPKSIESNGQKQSNGEKP